MFIAFIAAAESYLQKTLLSEFIAMTAHNGLALHCETVDNCVAVTQDSGNRIEIKLAKIHIIQFIWMWQRTGGKTAHKGHSQFHIR